MGVKEWKFWLLPFPTTNGHDLLKVLFRVVSCTGRLQTGSILPVSAICLTAFAQKEVLGGQGTWALRCLRARAGLSGSHPLGPRVSSLTSLRRDPEKHVSSSGS